MHFISDLSLRRIGYIYRGSPERGWVGYAEGNRPSINWNHVDGPLLYYSDGQLHWLTLWERFQCWRGHADAESIEAKRRPDLLLSVR